MTELTGRSCHAIAGGRRRDFLQGAETCAGEARTSALLRRTASKKRFRWQKRNPPEFAVVDLKMGGAPGLVAGQGFAPARPQYAHRGADRLCQHRHRSRGHQAGRDAVSCQARERGRNRGSIRPHRQRQCADQDAADANRKPGMGAYPARAARTQTTMYRPPRAPSTCTAARCSANWRSHLHVPNNFVLRIAAKGTACACSDPWGHCPEPPHNPHCGATTY